MMAESRGMGSGGGRTGRVNGMDHGAGPVCPLSRPTQTETGPEERVVWNLGYPPSLLQVGSRQF